MVDDNERQHALSDAAGCPRGPILRFGSIPKGSDRCRRLSNDFIDFGQILQISVRICQFS